MEKVVVGTFQIDPRPAERDFRGTFPFGNPVLNFDYSGSFSILGPPAGNMDVTGTYTVLELSGRGRGRDHVKSRVIQRRR